MKENRSEWDNAAYQFLLSHTQTALQKLTFLKSSGTAAADSVFSALCFLCFSNDTSCLNSIFSLLRSTAPSSFSHAQILEFYYELTHKLPPINEFPGSIHAFCESLAQCSLSQLELGSDSIDTYVSFLSSTLDEWQQLRALYVSYCKKKAARNFSRFSKRLFVFILLLLLLFVLWQFTFVQTITTLITPGDSFSMSSFPEDDASSSSSASSYSDAYSSYVDYYENIMDDRSNQTNSLIIENYLEHLEDANISAYVQEGDSCYHLSATCPRLTTEEPTHCTLEEAIRSGHPYPCPECAN